MKQILHITSKIDWDKAKQVGTYRAPSLEKAGFIHCSLAQYLRTLKYGCGCTNCSISTGGRWNIQIARRIVADFFYGH